MAVWLSIPLIHSPNGEEVMFGKKRITGLDIAVMNALQTVLAAAGEELQCGGNLLDISELTIKTTDCSGPKEDIFVVKAMINLNYIHRRPAIEVSGGVERETNPRGPWKPYSVWWVRFGGKTVTVQGLQSGKIWARID